MTQKPSRKTPDRTQTFNVKTMAAVKQASMPTTLTVTALFVNSAISSIIELGGYPIVADHRSPRRRSLRPRPQGPSKGCSAEQYARLVLEDDLKSTVNPRRHISDVIRDNMRGVPPEILAAMPSDGASEHDHYIYGSPKRRGTRTAA